MVGLVLLVLSAIGLALSLFPPRYLHRPLEYWVIQLKQGDQQEKAQAREALQHFGGRAVPELVGVLERQEPAWKLRMLARFPMLNAFLHTPSDQDRAYAAAALGELGSGSSAAIPALQALGGTIGTPYRAMVDAAVMKIKGEPLAPLIDALGNYNATNWNHLAHLVAEFGTNAQAAVPVLCRALTATNLNVSMSAGYAIGYIHSQPSVAVPALIEHVRAGGWDVRNSIWALGEFEAEARAAVTLLLQKVADTQPMIRQSALGSLKRILPAERLPTLVPLLVANASDPDPNLRGASQNMLRQLRAEGVR